MFLGSLITWVANAFRDPIVAAMEREDIKAAAHYWRGRIANARIAGMDGYLETSVNAPFTEEELDAFERSMAEQIARSFVYTPDENWLFQERGLDIGFYVHCAASKVGAASKLSYTGFFTRIRILPDKEVAFEKAPYRSHDWTTIWSASDCVKERIAA